MSEEACNHERGKIVSYVPHLELCYMCSRVLEGDPRSETPRKVIEVPRAVFEALMRSSAY
jgi:hypothetical protein